MGQKNSLKYLRISINTECNKACWYCFAEGIHKKKKEMVDIDAFIWILELLKENFNTINVRFTGGEPLLNSHLPLFVQETGKIGIKNIGITTNGTYLLDKYNELYEAGANSFAVHVTDIDSENWNIDEFANSIYKYKGIRYNIVVTESNFNRVLKVIEFSKDKKLDLLLLDLLENPYMSKSDHENEYVDLELLFEKLLELNYKKIIQNQNSFIFSAEYNDIKLVKRYKSASDYRYCTKMLDMHPILLTSDFNFRLCNHFGKKEFETNDLIKNRNSKKMIEEINKILFELNSCEECNKKIILK